MKEENKSKIERERALFFAVELGVVLEKNGVNLPSMFYEAVEESVVKLLLSYGSFIEGEMKEEGCCNKCVHDTGNFGQCRGCSCHTDVKLIKTKFYDDNAIQMMKYARQEVLEEIKKKIEDIDVSGGGSGRRLKEQLLALLEKDNTKEI